MQQPGVAALGSSECERQSGGNSTAPKPAGKGRKAGDEIQAFKYVSIIIKQNY